MSRRARLVYSLAKPTRHRERLWSRLSTSEKQAEALAPGSVLGRRR